ncbi:hypothetical protein ABTJ82_19695, partial [Acinetobacter baumannii]
HARHRRQHDREFGLDEVEETAIRPHGFAHQLGLGSGDEIAAAEQQLLGFGDDALDDFGGRGDIMDQPDGLACDDRGDVKIAGGP